MSHAVTLRRLGRKPRFAWHDLSSHARIGADAPGPLPATSVLSPLASIAALTAANGGFLLAPSDPTGRWVGTDGSGALADHDDPYGLGIEIAGLTGMTFEQALEAQPELGSLSNPTWSAGVGWAMTGDSATHSGTVPGNLQLGTLVAGKVYRLSWTQSGGHFVAVYGGTFSNILSNKNEDQHNSVVFTAPGTTLTFRTNADGAAVHSVSLKEMPNGLITAPSPSTRPDLMVDGNHAWWAFDGQDDQLDFAFPGGAGPANCDVLLVMRSSDDKYVLFNDDSDGKHGPVVQDGSTSTVLRASSGTIHINQADQPADRDSLHSEASSGSFVVLENRSANLSSWSHFRLSGYAGWFLSGDVALAVVQPNATEQLRTQYQTHANALRDALNA